MARLMAAGVACGALNELEDLIAHPQRRIAAVDTPHGEVELMGPGAKIVGQTISQLGPVPALGQHDEALRREFGGEKAS
jgi:crotonobetainyl-CoA:carnitine CoA-transferase CaiB-like acyl-CoA transferase